MTSSTFAQLFLFIASLWKVTITKSVLYFNIAGGDIKFIWSTDITFAVLAWFNTWESRAHVWQLMLLPAHPSAGYALALFIYRLHFFCLPFTYLLLLFFFNLIIFVYFFFRLLFIHSSFPLPLLSPLSYNCHTVILFYLM